MPFAVLGVRRGAQEDDSSAVHCLGDNFSSREEANSFAKESWPSAKGEFAEVYVEKHAGERWASGGGRCYVQAYRMLIEHFDELLAAGQLGEAPTLVHGYCRRFKTVLGMPVRSGHAWIEGNGRILDCGSYILKPSLHDKDEYRKEKEVVFAYSYSREDAERLYERNERMAYPWEQPPEEFTRERAQWDALQQSEGQNS
jgi:hypothetical protein